MRESRSATRSSIGRAGFLYFGVSSAGAALVDFSGTVDGLVDFFCAVDEMEHSSVRQRIERRRISIFLIRGGMSPLGRIMLLQDTGRRQRESQRLGYVGTAAFGCRRSEAPQGEATDSSYNPASYSLRFRMRIEYTLSVKDLLEAQGAQLGWPIRTLPFVGGLLILSGVGMFLQN